MHIRFLIISLLICAAEIMTAQESVDTVKVIGNVKEVVITRIGDKTFLEAVYNVDSTRIATYNYEVSVEDSGNGKVFSDNWGLDLPFMRSDVGKGRVITGKRRKLSRRVTGFRHIYWGWRFNSGEKERVKNCFELGVRDVIGVAWKRGGSELETGLGFGMRRLLAQPGYCYEGAGDAVALLPPPEGIEPTMSRLDIWSFQVPVLYNQKLCRGFKFSLGGILNFNTYAKAVTKTISGGIKEKSVYKGLHQNFLTPEIFAGIYHRGIGVYSTYSPVKLFREAYGPAVKGWTLGVDIIF